MLLCSCREDSHRTSLIAGNMAYNKLFSCTCSIYIYIYIFSIHFAPHSKVCIQNTLSEILHACNPTSPLRIVHSFCCSWFFEGDSYKRRVLYWSSFNTGLFFFFFIQEICLVCYYADLLKYYTGGQFEKV